MITEQDIEKAFDWLEDNTFAAAAARAERSYAEEYRKSLKAILMSESNAKTAAEREQHAYSHEKYLEHLKAIKDAVLKDEMFRARVKRLEWMIEFWRTQESSRRAMGKV